MKKSCRNNSVMLPKNQQIWNLRKETKAKILIEEDLEEAFGSTSTEKEYIHNPSNELQCEEIVLVIGHCTLYSRQLNRESQRSASKQSQEHKAKK